MATGRVAVGMGDEDRSKQTVFAHDRGEAGYVMKHHYVTFVDQASTWRYPSLQPAVVPRRGKLIVRPR